MARVNQSDLIANNRRARRAIAKAPALRTAQVAIVAGAEARQRDEAEKRAAEALHDLPRIDVPTE